LAAMRSRIDWREGQTARVVPSHPLLAQLGGLASCELAQK
jgi:hypothetical protein